MCAVSRQWEDAKNEVLARVDYPAIYRDLRKARRSGPDHISACCPFHDDKKPSFSANLRTGAWT